MAYNYTWIDPATQWSHELDLQGAVQAQVPRDDFDVDDLFAPPGLDMFAASSSSPVPRALFADSPPYASSFYPPPAAAALPPRIRTSGPPSTSPVAPSFSASPPVGLKEPSFESGTDASTYMMYKMSEHLTQIAKEVSNLQSSSSSKGSLADIPKGTGSAPLPSAKAWRQWVSLKLLTWCSMQSEGFNVVVEQILQSKKPDLTTILQNPNYASANRTLAHELTTSMDTSLSPYLSGVDKTNGVVLVLALANAITANSNDRISALHKRFSEPDPVSNPALLQHSLKTWYEDLEELREAGAHPCKETAMSSLHRLVSGLPDLKSRVDMADVFHPGNISVLYKIISSKAAEWAVLAADARTAAHAAQSVGGTGGAHVARQGRQNAGKEGGIKSTNTSWVPCGFYFSGWCKYGDSCRFDHGNGNTASTQPLHKDACRICGQITDPPHWGDECPLLGVGQTKGSGKESKGTGPKGGRKKGAEGNPQWLGGMVFGQQGAGNLQSGIGKGNNQQWAGNGNNQQWAGIGNNQQWAGIGNNQQWAGNGNNQQRVGKGVGQQWAGQGYNQQWAGSGDEQQWAGDLDGLQGADHDQNDRKRTRINVGQLDSEEPVTLEHLTQMAERFMNQQKADYKSTKALLEKLKDT